VSIIAGFNYHNLTPVVGEITPTFARFLYLSEIPCRVSASSAALSAFLYHLTPDTVGDAYMVALTTFNRLFPETPVFVTADFNNQNLILNAFRATKVYEFGILPMEIEFLRQSISRVIEHEPSTVVERDKESDTILVTGLSKEIQQIVLYIDQHYQNRMPVEFISSLFNMSPDNFSRKFSKELGMSFREYLKTIRLQQAHYLLHNTSLSIEEIAFRVGFSDPSLFSRMYYAKYMIRPSICRRDKRLAASSGS